MLCFACQATWEAMDSSSWPLTHHKHYTHRPHMHTSCTHLHGHSRTIHSLRRSHTTRGNTHSPDCSVGCHTYSLAHTHVRTQSCTRSLAHSHTHLLLQSFTPIHFCTLYEKTIFTRGVIRSFNFLSLSLNVHASGGRGRLQRVNEN